MVRQRIAATLLLTSGQRLSLAIPLPVAPGHCVRITRVVYSVDTVRVTVPTLVQAMYALTPRQELAQALPVSLRLWLEEPQFWFPWVQTLHIGSTADEAMVETTHGINLVPGVDIVGTMYFCVFSVNWAVNSLHRVDLYYSIETIGDVERRALRARDRRRP